MMRWLASFEKIVLLTDPHPSLLDNVIVMGRVLKVLVIVKVS